MHVTLRSPSDPRNPSTRATIVRITYLTISLSDIQEGGHNPSKRLSEGKKALIAKIPLHRFKRFLKGPGLFSPRAWAGFGRRAAVNPSVRAGVLIWTLVNPTGCLERPGGTSATT